MIPPDLVPHLFEPFETRRRQQPGHQGGSGLGLYIVQEIARAHGGEIEVTSAPPAGTTFRVKLPRVAARP